MRKEITNPLVVVDFTSTYCATKASGISSKGMFGS